MTFLSAGFNADAVKLGFLNQTSLDANQGIQALLGGAVVQELDAQIDLFSADLMTVNTEKQLIRNDINSLSALSSDKIRVEEDNVYVHEPQSEPPTYFEMGDEVVQLNGEEFIAVEDLAQSLGVNFTYGEGNKKKIVGINMIATIQEALENKLKDLNSTSEMKMINFQSLMDARKQAMMMLSNMVNSDNQTKMSIIQNLKG